jgi:hypothetical protein
MPSSLGSGCQETSLTMMRPNPVAANPAGAGRDDHLEFMKQIVDVANACFRQR